MPPLQIDDQTRAGLVAQKTMIELKDDQGNVIGYFVPPTQAERLLRLWGDTYLEGVEAQRMREAGRNGTAEPPNVWDYTLEELLERVAYVEEKEQLAYAEGAAEDPVALDRLVAEEQGLPQLTTREVLERIQAKENDGCATS